VVAIHEDRQLGAAVPVIDVLQPGRANEPILADLADGVEEAFALLRLLADPLQPAPGLVQAHRRLVAGQAADLGVVDAGHVGRQIAFLERTQPDLLAP